MVTVTARDEEYYCPGPPLATPDGRVVLRSIADVTDASEAERRGDLSGAAEDLAAALTQAGFPMDPEQMHLLFHFAWAKGPDRHAAIMDVIAEPLAAARNLDVAGLARALAAEHTAG